MDEAASLVMFDPDAAATVLHIVDAFYRGVACGIVGLALARIRTDTLIGAGGCYFWPEFIVIFVLPSKHSHFIKTGRTIEPLIARPLPNSMMNVLRGFQQYKERCVHCLLLIDSNSSIQWW